MKQNQTKPRMTHAPLLPHDTLQSFYNKGDRWEKYLSEMLLKGRITTPTEHAKLHFYKAVLNHGRILFACEKIKKTESGEATAKTIKIARKILADAKRNTKLAYRETTKSMAKPETEQLARLAGTFTNTASMQLLKAEAEAEAEWTKRSTMHEINPQRAKALADETTRLAIIAGTPTAIKKAERAQRAAVVAGAREAGTL